MSAPATSSSSKPTTPEEIWTSTEFSNRDSIVRNFPLYVQEQYRIAKERLKGITKGVNIELFTLKTPFADQTLLLDTSLVIEPGKRQCLYGPNSSGKTLLMTSMSEYKLKEFPRHLHVHHCRELEPHELGETVINTVVHCNPYLNVLFKVEKKIKELLSEEVADAAKKDGLESNLDFIKMTINTMRGYDAEERAGKMLRVLGFDDFGQKKLVSALSGGLRMRVALCMAFFIDADLLLLDEPTNHLDFPSVLWLENRLRGYKGSFLLVSHDRELLNNVCTGVMLIEDKQIKYYNCGFKEFEKKKGLEDKKRNEEIDKFLEKNRNADPSTPIGRMRYDKKIWQEKYLQHLTAMQGKFTFPAATPLAQQLGADGKPLAPEDFSLINLQNVRFSYDVSTGVFIFNDPISFNVTASTRCGVMGPNGAGKSTLLKLLTGKLTATDGTVATNPDFKLAYFGQHSTAELTLEQTAIEFMMDQFPEEKQGILKAHLNKTGVPDTVANTRMERLSFSQRSCVIFAKLTFVCPHLLILDEPTNFLDLESVDSLISACNKYPGALLLVSHNRDFLKRCAKTFLSVVPGQFLFFNDLKTAEQKTYSFITEMEEGGKVGADALSKTPGGGSVHSSQKVGDDSASAAAATEKPKRAEDGSISISMSSTPKPTPKPAAAAAAPTYTVGEKIQAIWTDGKWYAATIKKVEKDKYTVTYTQYGNTTTVPVTGIRKAPAAGAAAAAPAAKPAAKK